jgi:ribosomal subunit interface protein
MDIRTKATDYEMTPDTEDYLAQRLSALEKFLGDKQDTTRCEVEIGRDAGRPRHGKNLYFAEVRIMTPGEEEVYARNNAETVNAAIDDVKEEVEYQLRKRKRRGMYSARRIGASVKRWMRWGNE